MKKMWKVFAVFAAVALISTPMAFAEPPHWSGIIGGNPGNFGGNPNNGNAFWKGGQDEGPGNGPSGQTVAFGALDVKSKAKAKAFDGDLEVIPNGAAFGISGAKSKAGADADGFVLNGEIEGEVNTTAGALTNTTAYTWFPGAGDLSIGVGSYTLNQTFLGADAKIKADPDFGLAFTDADMYGKTSQFSLNASGLGESPFFFRTDGFTGGIATQNSKGGFHGDAHAVDFMMGKSGAGMGAEIDMLGQTWSESYRYVDWNNGARTEGMGTVVGATTDVETNGYDYDWDKGIFNCTDADVHGGFNASGNVGAITVQDTRGGKGVATATGLYEGAGRLDDDYSGSAIGGTYTNITTVDGMKGSVVNSGANMTVHSQID
jgi:hypothetical protein